MTYSSALRVAPIADRNWSDANAGTIHDPLWMLAHQWQLGEFQGENAASPVRAEVTTTTRTIQFAEGAGPMRDLPPEVLVESEADQWWTLGRRLRWGRIFAEQLALDRTDPGWLFASVPPPFDQVSPAWDGLAIWRARAAELPEGARPPLPAEPSSAWDAEQLVYHKDGAFTAEETVLHVRRHQGGRLDWYSVDTEPAAEGGQPPEPRLHSPVIPASIEYPGMPRTGLWEIEDRDTDIAGIAPDAAHSATAIMTSLFFSHRDEWFDLPVPGNAGEIVRIVELSVTDSFGQVYTAGVTEDGTPHGPVGLRTPTDLVETATGPLEWGVLRTTGLAPGELVLWQTAERPIEGNVVERVQFGVDDQSNVVWAVERRIAEREPQPAPPDDSGPDLPDSIVPTAPGDLSGPHAYYYIPGSGAVAHWIPYTISAQGPRILNQRRLLDLTRFPPHELPAAQAEVIRVRGDGGGSRTAESVIPLDGLEIERRWILARSATGEPLLWIQRRRLPLFSPPARTLRFDIAAPAAPGSEDGQLAVI